MANAQSTTSKKTRAKKDESKAGNGQGTVYQLANGKWRWQVTLGYTLEGKIQRAGGVCDNITLAEIAKAKAIADFARGLLASAETITLADYAEKWLKRQKGLRPTTLRGYKADIDYSMKYLGKMKLKDVRPHHVKDCLVKLSEQTMTAGMGKGKPMSSRTLSMVRKRLKAIFAEAVVDQLIYVNPCEAVKGIKQPTLETVGVVMDFVQMTRFHELGLALYEAGVCRLLPCPICGCRVGLQTW